MDTGDTVNLHKSKSDDATVISGEPVAPATIAVPKRLGAVQLMRQIGQGGMGVVWLGHHELLNRDVAVKFLLNLRADENDPGFASLLEGARAAAAIRHKGLNAVLHADVIEQVPFLVMEYVEGPTLSQLISHLGRLSPALARALIEPICAAVGELHDNGVVHRDIKPSNVLLAMDGNCVLTDFGLACWKAGQDLNFCVSSIAGTPVYMAPEMWERQVSARSDVYALGIMLYEMFVGEPPFDGTPNELGEAHRSRPLPSEALAQLPSCLAQLIDRATTKNPVFRYKSARHLLRALEDSFANMDQMSVAKARGQTELVQTISRLMRGDIELPAGETHSSGTTYYDRLTSLADVKKRAIPNELPITQDDLVDRVQEDVACSRCRQNLKGEPVTGRCPECLLLVKHSMQGASTTPLQTKVEVSPPQPLPPEEPNQPSNPWSLPPSHSMHAPLQGTKPAEPAKSPSPMPRISPPPTPQPSLAQNLKQFWRDFFGR